MLQAWRSRFPSLASSGDGLRRSTGKVAQEISPGEMVRGVRAEIKHIRVPSFDWVIRHVTSSCCRCAKKPDKLPQHVSGIRSMFCAQHKVQAAKTTYSGFVALRTDYVWKTVLPAFEVN